MRTKRLTYLLTCLLALPASPINAQTDSLLLRNYDVVKQQDKWLTQLNAAALTRFSSDNIVKAEASLTKADGGHIDYYDSPDVLQFDAHIESFYRLGQRTVVFGSMSYINWSGKDMTGSAFMHLTPYLSSLTSYRYPFDLVEDSLTNEGKKHRDVYQLTGGIGIDVWRGISLGARVDYTSANYAKYKDLRHKNKLMDLSVTAGIYAPLLPWLSTGAHYLYHRQTESLSFSTYGKSEKVYMTLIDYGAAFGRVEQFGNEGYTDKSHEMPWLEDGHGGDFQLEVRPMTGLSVFGAIGVSHGSGYYGRRSPYTITYTNHERDVMTINGAVKYVTTASQHTLDISFRREKLKNQAETYREMTNQNGANYYEYYDPVETGDKWWRDLTLAWTSLLGMQGETPTWQLQAAYTWGKRTQRAYLYPFFRRQQLHTNEVSLSATRNLIGSKGIWSLTLEGAFGKGNGEPFEDYAFTTPSSKQEKPATMEAMLWRNYQYLTAAQFRIGGSVQYAFIFPGTRLKTHARLSASHHKANETYDYSQGRNRTQLALAIGCTF